MENIDVESTAQVIDDMVETLHRAAQEVQRIAIYMREKGDLTYVAEALNIVANLQMQLRIDLLVTRPLRAVLRENR